ncbi:choline/ethanolaminephosphotransferase 1b isoform X2, partial [Tachysurus ichikawai]
MGGIVSLCVTLYRFDSTELQLSLALLHIFTSIIGPKFWDTM